MSSRILFWCLIILIMQMGCKTAKLGSSTTPVVEKSKKYLLKRLEGNALEYRIFNGKGKVKYDDGETRVSFVANIRMHRDSLIWINASFLGMEVARILIRPDSIFAINRYEKTYMVESYENFDSLYQVPATFDQLQDIILGNSLVTDQTPIEVQFESPHYQLTQVQDQYHLSQIVDGRNYSPIAIGVHDTKSNYEIMTKLDDLRAVDKSQLFSYFRSYIIKKDNIQTTSIQINYSEIDTKTIKKTNFSIPSSYSPSDL